MRGREDDIAASKKDVSTRLAEATQKSDDAARFLGRAKETEDANEANKAALEHDR